MRIYATPEQLQQFLGLSEPPVNAQVLLRYASLLVEKATRFDVYSVDKYGLPTDPHVAEAMRDATLMQSEMWHHAGLNPAKGATGQKAQVASESVPGGSVSYGSAISTQDLGTAATTLCEAALSILTNAGLGNRWVRYL